MLTTYLRGRKFLLVKNLWFAKVSFKSDSSSNVFTASVLDYILLWNFGGIVVKGEVRSTMRKSCPSAIFSTTNPTLTGLPSNLGVRQEISKTNCKACLGVMSRPR
jgi:hypothetical protein